MTKKRLALLMTFLFVLTGCSGLQQQDSSHNSHNNKPSSLTYELGSDNWEAVTTNTDSLETLDAYQFAVEHPEVLDYIPCYCGCYEEAGHESNKNCFVDEIEGTTVQLDTMGFG